MEMPKSQMSEEHKKALAEGRAQSKAVRQYLEAMEAQKPKRGRPRSRESIENRLAMIDQELEDAGAMTKLQLVQERLELTDELEQLDATTDMEELEAEFVKAAKPYGDRKGISYKAWREVGVPAAVLKRAGITQATS